MTMDLIHQSERLRFCYYIFRVLGWKLSHRLIPSFGTMTSPR